VEHFQHKAGDMATFWEDIRRSVQKNATPDLGTPTAKLGGQLQQYIYLVCL